VLAVKELHISQVPLDSAPGLGIVEFLCIRRDRAGEIPRFLCDWTRVTAVTAVTASCAPGDSNKELHGSSRNLASEWLASQCQDFFIIYSIHMYTYINIYIYNCNIYIQHIYIYIHSVSFHYCKPASRCFPPESTHCFGDARRSEGTAVRNGIVKATVECHDSLIHMIKLCDHYIKIISLYNYISL